jgi:hypothetical protein
MTKKNQGSCGTPSVPVDARVERSEANAPVALACADCGLLYENFPLDMTIPDDQWLLIFGRSGGVLCACCIVTRAAKLPSVVAVRAQIEFAEMQCSNCRQTPPAQTFVQLAGGYLICEECIKVGVRLVMGCGAPLPDVPVRGGAQQHASATADSTVMKDAGRGVGDTE